MDMVTMTIIELDDGLDLPGDGHLPDEDVLFDDLQRGAGLHLRACRCRGRHDRRRRVLPGADRRHAAADPDLGARAPDRDARGRRRHRAQRSLSRRAAHARAHLLQADLRRRRADGLCRLPSAMSRRSAARCPAAFPARRRRSSTRACACRRSRSRSAGKDNDDVWKLLLANVRTPRHNYGDYRALIGSVELGAQRTEALIRKYGKEVFTRTCRDLMDYSEARMRAELEGLSRRALCLRRLHGGRRHRGPALPHPCGVPCAGRRDRRRLHRLRQAGEGTDQRHPGRHLERHLQRAAAPDRSVDPQELRLLPADQGAGAARHGGECRLSRRPKSAATPRPIRASPTP